MIAPTVTLDRALALAAQGQTQYWFVASMRDCAALLRGEVSRPVYQQAVRAVHGDGMERRDSYAARRAQEDAEVIGEEVLRCYFGALPTTISPSTIGATGIANAAGAPRAARRRPSPAPATSPPGRARSRGKRTRRRGNRS